MRHVSLGLADNNILHMKTIIKLFLAFILLSITVTTVNAQAHYRRNIYGDFFGGMTMASMDMEGQNEFKKHKVGFMVGGNANFKFFQNLEFQTGFYLMKKGSLKHKKGTFPRESLPDEIVDVKTTIDANYMQVPFNLGFEVPLSRELFLNMHAGVFVAYGFKGDKKQRGFTTEKGGAIVSQDQSITRTFSGSSLKKWDYGVGANIGLVYDIFILRLQYDHGLADVATNIISDLPTDTAETSKHKWSTRNYSICLGFRF